MPIDADCFCTRAFPWRGEYLLDPCPGSVPAAWAGSRNNAHNRRDTRLSHAWVRHYVAVESAYWIRARRSVEPARTSCSRGRSVALL